MLAGVRKERVRFIVMDENVILKDYWKAKHSQPLKERSFLLYFQEAKKFRL